MFPRPLPNALPCLDSAANPTLGFAPDSPVESDLIRPRALVPLALPLALSGCLAIAAAGTGSSVGYIATEDRTLQENADDIVTCTQAIQMWANYSTALNDDLNCRTYQGRMLVTGTVPTQEWRDEAIKRAWTAKGVKEVYDEIKVGKSESFGSSAKDAVISQKFKANLLTDADIHSNNYIVTTDRGVLYIIGSARTDAERGRVLDYARNTADVKRVVSYIRIRAVPPSATAGVPAYTPNGEPPPPAPPPYTPAPGDTPADTPTPRGDITVTPLK